jgi:hypothetical protein
VDDDDDVLFGSPPIPASYPAASDRADLPFFASAALQMKLATMPLIHEA